MTSNRRIAEIQPKDSPVSCKVFHEDSRELLAKFEGKADLIVTSPPYADARRKHYDSVHPDEYTEWFMSFSQHLKNALKPDGSLVINIKDKVVDGVRHRYVWQTIMALMQDGWHCIDDYIWHKSNPMPGWWPTRLRDGWEYCFHLAPQKKPYFDANAVRQPIGDWAETRLKNLSENDLSRHDSNNDSGFGRDLSQWVGKKTVLPSNVLSIAVVGKNKKHPAVFPVGIPEFFIKLLSRENGLIIDPFGGSGTTGVAALRHNRNCVLIDNNEDYCLAAVQRLRAEVEYEPQDTANSNGQADPTSKRKQQKLL
jgi:site-specific DNA-methyltransferase (adenine-specific)